MNIGDGEIPPEEFGGISRRDGFGVSPGMNNRLLW
jgi:hypothetical protein